MRQPQVRTNVQKIKGNPTTKPGRYSVLLLGDSATPLNFVVDVLTQLFNLPDVEALTVARKIQSSGSGRIGKFTLEIAETKAEMVMRAAKAHQFSLVCETVSA
jgi:ATP-dependent Clp protease adaptor protein ClpS